MKNIEPDTNFPIPEPNSQFSKKLKMFKKAIFLFVNKVYSYIKCNPLKRYHDAPQWLNLVLQLILVIFASQALNVWYEESRGLDKYNVARDGLVAIYDLRDVLALVKQSDLNASQSLLRGGAVFATEGYDEFQDKGHWTDSAFRSRLSKLRAALDRYYEIIPRIEVVLGEELRDDLNTITFGAEFYYYAGIDLYEAECHPFDINVQVDPKNSSVKKCIPGLEKFADDRFLEGFYFRFNRVDKALRAILE